MLFLLRLLPETVVDERAQFVHVELRSIDEFVSECRNRRQTLALSLYRCTNRRMRAHRMRTTCLAVTPHQDLVIRLEVQHFRGNNLLYGLQDHRQLVEPCAFADVYDQRRAMSLRRLAHQLGKAGNQVDRHIVDAVIAEIFEDFEHRRFAGTAHAGDDYQFRSSVRLRAPERVRGLRLGFGVLRRRGFKAGFAEAILRASYRRLASDGKYCVLCGADIPLRLFCRVSLAVITSGQGPQGICSSRF